MVWIEGTDFEGNIHSKAQCSSEFPWENNRQPPPNVLQRSSAPSMPMYSCHYMSKHAAAFIKKHSCFSLSPPSSVSTDNIIIYISFRCVFSSSTNIHTRMRAPTQRPTDAEVCFLHAVQVSALINLGILELFSQYSLLLLSLRTSGCLFSKVTLSPFFIPGCACWFVLAFISQLKKKEMLVGIIQILDSSC